MSENVPTFVIEIPSELQLTEAEVKRLEDCFRPDVEILLRTLVDAGDPRTDDTNVNTVTVKSRVREGARASGGRAGTNPAGRKRPAAKTTGKGRKR